MDELRRRITAAVEAGGREAALDALRWAAAWAVAELERAEPGGGPVAALDGVIRLDDAVTELARLSSAVSGLLAEADAGPEVEEYLRTRQEDLAALGESLSALRARRAALGEREERVRAAVDEHAELSEQVTRLRRAERLAGALGELAAQRALIERRLVEIGPPVAAAEEGVFAGSEELLLLSEERRAALTPRVRESLERAATAQSSLRAAEEAMARAEADAEAATARFAELADLREQRLESAKAYARADREIADALAGLGAGLSGAERARVLLDGIDERLGEVDAALAGALADHETHARRPRVPWGDDTTRARA
ncbi:hypothetical protein AB0C27_16125 [Nonomuraea sp. NPDC048882]|uniref:hypothetical protein n=1 Tax=Nonomuraea sp. NPDC048882 TaxID=3154347 RepID=UPI0033CA0E00